MDSIESIREQVTRAHAAKQPLAIRGGGSKAFLGNAVAGEVLEAGQHAGIIDYAPRELVVTVRAGTRLADLEQALASEGQMLPFEPPHFGANATVGGTLACGLSGPRRPYTGSARDFVLGVRIIDGLGQDLSFGGRVIKNVAGFDVARLQTGAHGTLGVILEASFKVLPRPASEASLRFEMDEAAAITTMNRWAGQPIPLSATAWAEGELWVRLSGAEAGVKAASAKLGGEIVAPEVAGQYWLDLREQRAAFFTGAATLWRIAVPSTTAPLGGAPVLEWGGGQRWLADNAGGSAAPELRAKVAAVGGHVTRFRGANSGASTFHPLASGVAKLHHRLKACFDPAGILNPGRMDNF